MGPARLFDPKIVANDTWKRVEDLLDDLQEQFLVLSEELADTTDYDEEGYTDDDRLDHARNFVDWVEALQRRMRRRDLEAFSEVFDDFQRLADEYDPGLDLAATLSEIDDLVTLLKATEHELLYLPSSPLIDAPRILVALSDDLLRAVAREPRLLYAISPRDFEALIAEVFARQGFQVELTQMTRDGGKDIIAVSKILDIQTKYIIECKRYAAHRTVGLALVQRLLGVKLATAANKAILATTTTFTRDARALETQMIWDLALKDYNAIVTWVQAAATRSGSAYPR